MTPSDLLVRALLPLLLLSQVPAQDAGKSDGIRWLAASELQIEGRGFDDCASEFVRLPDRAEGKVRAPVWNLSRDSTGVTVRFRSNADAIHLRWWLTRERLAMPHMPATGVSGLDLYASDGGGPWRWVGCARPRGRESTARLSAAPGSEQREFLLYLPLYNGVTKLEVGVAEGRTLTRALRRAPSLKPIVFYGTSITQGACASRPGMVHTAILGRRLGREIINLGFSGNGRMEPELAELVETLDPAVFVFDCLPNMDAKLIDERLVPFVQRIRAKHPKTPILLVEDRFYQNKAFSPRLATRNARNHEAHDRAWNRLLELKVQHLHRLKAAELLGDDGEGTVDGSHPTDLGFFRQANAFEKVLSPLLRK